MSRPLPLPFALGLASHPPLRYPNSVPAGNGTATSRAPERDLGLGPCMLGSRLQYRVNLQLVYRL